MEASHLQQVKVSGWVTWRAPPLAPRWPPSAHQRTAVLRAVFGPVLCQPLLLLVQWLGLENHFFKFESGVTVQSPFLKGKHGLSSPH